MYYLGQFMYHKGYKEPVCYGGIIFDRTKVISKWIKGRRNKEHNTLFFRLDENGKPYASWGTTDDTEPYEDTHGKILVGPFAGDGFFGVIDPNKTLSDESWVKLLRNSIELGRQMGKDS